MDPLWTLSVVFFLVGVTGTLLRRSLWVVLLSVQLALLGSVLAFVTFAMAQGDAPGLAKSALILFICVAHFGLGVAATVAAFRRRAVLNLDELRELRG